VVATGELVGSVVLSLLALLAPLLAGAAALILLVILARRLVRLLGERRCARPA
jgi:hypothetical protein